jgi:hypothetical protein
MERNRRRMLTGLAVTGVLSGALAGGGVALASTSSAHSPSAAVTATTSPSPSATPKKAPASGTCDHGPGGMGRPGGMGGPGGIAGAQPGIKAAASYLGISQAKLFSELRSGKSLAAVAKAEGKSVPGLENAILAAATSEINARSGLTAAQKKEMISELKSHLNALVTMTPPSGPPTGGMGGMGGPMGGGMQGM